MNSIEMSCKCGKAKGWITENIQSKPCPNCGRIYIGIYSAKKYTIICKEIKNKNRPSLFKKIIRAFKLIGGKG